MRAFPSGAAADGKQPGLTDIQRAGRWFHRNKTCFGGMMDSFGLGGAGNSREGRMEAIRALSLRLDRAVIEHLSWEKCIALYDRPTTFFFCDPPYTECGRTSYDGWTNTDVQKLRDVLIRVKGKWLVTLNDAPAIRRIFEGCQFVEVSRALGINNKGGGKAKTYRELIIAPAAEG